MGFKILLYFILIVYPITITYNSNSNKDFTTSLISLKNLNSGLTPKEFYKLVRRKRRCTIKRPYNNTTAVVFLRLLLLLSGDVELNPEPWTSGLCNFRYQDKYENHLVNQQLVSCIYCLKDLTPAHLSTSSNINNNVNNHRTSTNIIIYINCVDM